MQLLAVLTEFLQTRRTCYPLWRGETTAVKGTVHTKQTFAENVPILRPPEEFVSSSDLEKCSIALLSQQWMLCSEWVPSEWESKQLIKTSQYQLFGLYSEWVPSEFESKQLIKTSQYQLFGLYSEWVPSEFESKQLIKTSQYQLFGLCSEWVPSEWESDKNITISAVWTLQWMGAVRIWVQTADKNITISAVWTLQWMGAVRIWVQTADKNITISAVWTLQWMGAVRIWVQTADKTITISAVWTTVNGCRQNESLIKTSQYQLFGLCSEWVPSEFESKQLIKTSQYQLFWLCSGWVPSEFESKQLIKTSQYQLFGLLWMGAVRIWVQTADKNITISAVWTHSDGTHSLQSIHCWDSDARLHFSKSDEENSEGAMFGWTIAKFSTSSMLSLTAIQCSRGEIANSHCGDM